MKYFNLDNEEKELLEEFERGEWKRVKNFKQAKKRAEMAAKYTLSKIKNINIRLSLQDVQRLKAKAAEHGLPYQTLAATVLHNFANEKIKLTL